MKLYTEEQLRKAIAMGFDWCHQKQIPNDWMIDEFIKSEKPIELPTDEEIKYIASGMPTVYDAGWESGAKWVKDAILNHKG